MLKLTLKCYYVIHLSEAGVKNPNPRKRKKQSLKMGHGGTLDSAASGVLGERVMSHLHPSVGSCATFVISIDCIKGHFCLGWFMVEQL